MSSAWSSPITWVKVLAIAVLAAILYLTFAGPQTSRPNGSLPPFELELLSGGELKSSALTGRVTILNFFATWCGPCQMEMPELDHFARGLDPKQAAFYGVAAGYEHRLDVRKFVEERKLGFPVALDGEGVLAGLGSSALPTTVIVDPSGTVTQVIQGMVTEKRLQQEVARLSRSPGP
jgi:thiol-disulfide isomerase/thioredoxin